MPAGFHPLSSDRHRKHVVELKRINRRASASCQPDDTRAVGAPGEMARPLLSARIEEFDAATCEWIDVLHFEFAENIFL